MVCEKGASTTLNDVVGRPEGASFACAWRDGLTGKAHELSSEDIRNLEHAGSMVASFQEARRKTNGTFDPPTLPSTTRPPLVVHA